MSDEDTRKAWARMRLDQERKLAAAALDPRTRAAHLRLAELHERALALGGHQLAAAEDR